MNILTFINSLTNEDLNRIRNSKSDAEARRLLREHQALQLQQTGVMRSALNQEEAFKIFTQHNKNDGFIQWKGTDVCMDFTCECGHHNHYDDYFAYVVKCGGCGNLYAPSCNVEMIKIKESEQFIESNF